MGVGPWTHTSTSIFGLFGALSPPFTALLVFVDETVSAYADDDASRHTRRNDPASDRSKCSSQTAFGDRTARTDENDFGVA